MFDMISKYYKAGFYKKEDLDTFKAAGYLTDDQYNGLIK